MANELTHGYMLPADAPGTPNRRWRCQHCNALGTLADLAAFKCPKARPASDDELLEAIDGPKRRRGR